MTDNTPRPSTPAPSEGDEGQRKNYFEALSQAHDRARELAIEFRRAATSTSCTGSEVAIRRKRWEAAELAFCETLASLVRRPSYTQGEAMREALTSALLSLAHSNISPDVQELLVHGNPQRKVAPHALEKALTAALPLPTRTRTQGDAMSDPTYVRDEINANPVWELAFTLSEIQNDNAPIGWGRYILLATCLLVAYDIKRKPDPAPKET